MHGDSLKCASTKIERREDSKSNKDVFENEPILDYLKQKELALDVTLKEKDWILQQAKWFE